MAFQNYDLEQKVDILSNKTFITFLGVIGISAAGLSSKAFGAITAINWGAVIGSITFDFFYEPWF